MPLKSNFGFTTVSQHSFPFDYSSLNIASNAHFFSGQDLLCRCGQDDSEDDSTSRALPLTSSMLDPVLDNMRSHGETASLRWMNLRMISCRVKPCEPPNLSTQRPRQCSIHARDELRPSIRTYSHIMFGGSYNGDEAMSLTASNTFYSQYKE